MKATATERVWAWAEGDENVTVIHNQTTFRNFHVHFDKQDTVFGFGKFSGHGKNRSQGGVWLHLASTFRVTVPSFRPPPISYYHNPHSLY
jgi:hypothetical protein